MTSSLIKAEVVQHTRSGGTELITVQIDTMRSVIAQGGLYYGG